MAHFLSFGADVVVFVVVVIIMGVAVVNADWLQATTCSGDGNVTFQDSFRLHLTTCAKIIDPESQDTIWGAPE